MSHHRADFAAPDESHGLAVEAAPLRLCREGAASGPEKGAIVRRLRRILPPAVVLFEDETILRWFPPLRFAWAPIGTQAEVPISGRNAKRALFGTINLRTGHRVVLRRLRTRQEDFQAFLKLLRQRYGKRPICLLLDRAPCHEAARSQAVATRLGIELVWLPKQCSELNAMDHLWRAVKGKIAANRQWTTIDAEAEYAEHWILTLSNRDALRKVGILSRDFWLKGL